MFQQEKLIPSANHEIGSSSNKLPTSTCFHYGLSPNESIASDIHIVISCYESNISRCWLIDFEANDRICCSKHFFE